MTPTPTDPMPRSRAHALRLLAAGLLAAGLLAAGLLAAGQAGAHVEADEPTVGPDGVTTIDFSFDHGCDGQPTTSLRVQIPDGVTEVVPEPKDGWEVRVSASEFGWTGGSIPDAEPATFRAAMRVSGEAGTTIYFPTLQGCPTAELAWIERPDPDGPEPEDVAPSVTLTETVAPAAPATGADAPTGSTPAAVLEEADTTDDTDTTDEASNRSTTGLVTIIVIVLIISGGAGLLYLRHRGKGRV
jgi:periplasmic copper chaperone A